MTDTSAWATAATEARARHGLYALASRVFVKEVDQMVLRALRKDAALRALSRRLMSGLEARAEEDVMEELAVDYATCFLVSGAPLSPHESVQAVAEGQLDGEAAGQVRLFYRRSGFVVPEGCPLFADHFALELEFMGHLCAKEASSLEGGGQEAAWQAKQLQARFMSTHLGRWYRPFLQKVERAMERSFYGRMASFTIEFLDSEREYLTGGSDGFVRR